MNALTPTRSAVTVHRLLGLCAASAAALLLGGCGTSSPRGYYPNAADQQLRSAAEASASPETSKTATADTASTYLKLVEQMQRDGLWFASLAHIDALEKRWGPSPDSLRLRADALRQTDQIDASRQMYGKLMGTPLEGAGYHGLGLLAGAQQDFPQAVRMLEQAQRRNPTDALLLSDLGYANLRAGQIAAARIPLMQAIQLQPDNPRVQVNVALYLQASGQTEQANALMASRSMPPATRTAIAAAARQLAPEVPPMATAEPKMLQVAASDVAMTDVRNESLVLKTAPWPRRVHVMVRPDPAQPASATSSPLPTDAPLPIPTSGVQP